MSVATAIIVLCAIAADRAPSTYRIDLDRPSRVGMKSPIEYFVTRTVRDEILWTGDAKPSVVETTTTALLSVNWEVLTADERGNTLSQAMTVNSFTAIRNALESTILPRGSRIVATATDTGTEFTVNGVPANDDVRSVLEIIVGLSTAKRAVNLDQIYGSAVPREVGESWPLNIDNVSSAYARRGINVKTRDIEGEVRLVAVEPYANELCLRISTREQLQSLTRELSEPRRGMSLQYKDDSTMTVRNEYWLPLFGEAKVLRIASSSEATYSIQGTNNGRKFTDMQTVRHTGYTRRMPSR
jgi:hypothetical protein